MVQVTWVRSACTTGLIWSGSTLGVGAFSESLGRKLGRHRKGIIGWEQSAIPQRWYVLHGMAVSKDGKDEAKEFFGGGIYETWGC